MRFFVPIFLTLSSALFAEPVTLVVRHARVARDTLVSVCASIENRSGKALKVFPPSHGAYGFTRYGFVRGKDTLWLRAYADVDLAPHPPVRIPRGRSFTSLFRVDLRDLHYERLAGSSSASFPSFAYESSGFQLIYQTGWMGASPPDRSRSGRKKWSEYDRMKLVSLVAPLDRGAFPCDTGISKLSP